MPIWTGPSGYMARLAGKIHLADDRTIERFDLVAIGEHWGVSTHTADGGRTGRGLVGIAFELADPNRPADRVAPQGIRDNDDYFGRK